MTSLAVADVSLDKAEQAGRVSAPKHTPNLEKQETARTNINLIPRQNPGVCFESRWIGKTHHWWQVQVSIPDCQTSQHHQQVAVCAWRWVRDRQDREWSKKIACRGAAPSVNQRHGCKCRRGQCVFTRETKAHSLGYQHSCWLFVLLTIFN